MDKAELAEALFEALAAGDDERVRALCTADVQIQQNNSPAMDLDGGFWADVANQTHSKLRR